jgi:hypothetical protein
MTNKIRHIITIAILIQVFFCFCVFAENSNNTKKINPFAPWLPKVKELIEKVQETNKIIEEQEIEEEFIDEKTIEATEETAEEISPTVQTPVSIEKKIEPPKIRVTGLIWNTDRPQAIVNNTIMEIGDQIENFEIVKIYQQGIEVTFSGKTFIIEIDKDDINPI